VVILVVAAAAVLAGCGQPQQVSQSGTVGANAQVGDVLLRNVRIADAPPQGLLGGRDATVRLTLINQAGQPDALTGITSDVATRVEIRSDTDCDGTAETLGRLALPARTDRSSPPDAPGPTDARYFLSLVDLRVGILAGGMVPITFTFQNAGSITIPTPVAISADSGTGTSASPAACGTPDPL
jgi:copper(I)-binding protein